MKPPPGSRTGVCCCACGWRDAGAAFALIACWCCFEDELLLLLLLLPDISAPACPGSMLEDDEAPPFEDELAAIPMPPSTL